MDHRTVYQTIKAAWKMRGRPIAAALILSLGFCLSQADAQGPPNPGPGFQPQPIPSGGVPPAPAPAPVAPMAPVKMDAAVAKDLLINVLERETIAQKARADQAEAQSQFLRKANEYNVMVQKAAKDAKIDLDAGWQPSPQDATWLPPKAK